MKRSGFRVKKTMKNVEERRALITRATDRLGEQTAKELAGKGAAVLVHTSASTAALAFPRNSSPSNEFSQRKQTIYLTTLASSNTWRGS